MNCRGHLGEDSAPTHLQNSPLRGPALAARMRGQLGHRREPERDDKDAKLAFSILLWVFAFVVRCWIWDSIKGLDAAAI